VSSSSAVVFFSRSLARAPKNALRPAARGHLTDAMASLGDSHCIVCDNGTGFVKVG